MIPSNFAKLALFTAALFLIGVVLAVKTRRFVHRSVRVRARILETREIRDGHYDPDYRKTPTYRHLVQFAEPPPASGKPRPGRIRPAKQRTVLLAETWGGSLPRKLAADGTLPVLYDPMKPGVVRIDSPWTLYFIPAFCCTPGLLLLALVAYVRLMK